MKNYRPQNGCYNCNHCFLKIEWDCDVEHYCLSKNPNIKRPLSGSVNMKEEFESGLMLNDKNEVVADDSFEKGYEAWNKWAKENKVDETSICDDWKERIIV